VYINNGSSPEVMNIEETSGQIVRYRLGCFATTPRSTHNLIINCLFTPPVTHFATMVIGPILRKITIGVSTGMGLAGEKYSDHKERKLALTEHKASIANAQMKELAETSEQGDNDATDERIWALDEAAAPPSYNEFQTQDRPGVERTVSDLVQDVTPSGDIETHAAGAVSLRLPYPVIIPQRRPGTKGRGWTRAYPPALKSFGLDQETFLRFLQNFEDASQADPRLKALYVAANIVGLIPGHITMAVSLSVSIAAG